jgi:hypothetical protein
MDAKKKNNRESVEKKERKITKKIINQMEKSLPNEKQKKKKDKVTRSLDLVRSNVPAKFYRKELSTATYIAKAIVCPKEFPGLRWASSYNGYKTAVASPFDEYNATFQGSSTLSYPCLPATDSCFFLFRCPERAAIYYDPNLIGNTYSYSLYSVSDNAPLTGFTPGTTWTTSALPTGATMKINPLYLQSNSSYKPHDSIMFCCRDQTNRNMFWLDNSGNLSIAGNVTALQVGEVVTFMLYKWTAEGPVLLYSQTATFVGNNFTAVFINVPAGYYYVDYIHNNNSNYPVTFNIGPISISCSGSVWCHRPLPGYCSNVLNTPSTRVYAASVMFSNEASLNSKQGKIAGVQVSGRNWFDFVNTTNSSFSNIASCEGSVTKTADTGMYAWMQPVQASDFEMRKDVTQANGALVNSFYPIRPSEGFILVYASITNYAGQDGIWKRTYGVEFDTTNNWFLKEDRRPSTEDISNALKILRNVPQFMDNPFHFKDMLKAVKEGSKAVAEFMLKHGPAVLNLAKVIAAI